MKYMLRLLSALGLLLGGVACTYGNAQVAESPVQVPVEPSPTIVFPSPTSPPVESPEATEFQGPSMLFFEIPDRLRVGEVVAVPLVLVGGGTVGELSVEIRLPIFYLQVMDDNPDDEGGQVLPGPLPEAALVEINEILADGIVRFKIVDLGSSDALSRTIMTMHVKAIAVSHEIVEIEFVQTSLMDPDGQALSYTPQSALVEVVSADAELADAGAVVEPTPTPMPTVAQLPPPTSTVPPVVIEESVMTYGTLLSGAYYRVQPAQTLAMIAQAFGSTPEAIATANGASYTGYVPTGTILRIPIAAPVGQVSYYVAPRDTLYSISRSFNLDLGELAAMNALDYPYTIKAGQWITLVP
ncbi:MAG: LysM peptidoglycan-binding domain-containing protein [Anaerolineae bacterium]|nr:LysM peptidoglycan-binding domain-containing protein [Anaerolineae bacterium]